MCSKDAEFPRLVKGIEELEGSRARGSRERAMREEKGKEASFRVSAQPLD